MPSTDPHQYMKIKNVGGKAQDDSRETGDIWWISRWRAELWANFMHAARPCDPILMKMLTEIRRYDANGQPIDPESPKHKNETIVTYLGHIATRERTTGEGETSLEASGFVHIYDPDADDKGRINALLERSKAARGLVEQAKAMGWEQIDLAADVNDALDCYLLQKVCEHCGVSYCNGLSDAELDTIPVKEGAAKQGINGIENNPGRYLTVPADTPTCDRHPEASGQQVFNAPPVISLPEPETIKQRIQQGVPILNMHGTNIDVAYNGRELIIDVSDRCGGCYMQSVTGKHIANYIEAELLGDWVKEGFFAVNVRFPEERGQTGFTPFTMPDVSPAAS